MSNIYYRFYQDGIVALARSLVLKNNEAALVLNRELAALGYPVVETEPATWKYYLNLAGEYHPSDERMLIRSVDTLTEVEFSKATLTTHRATAREYRTGSPFYRTLVRRFPNQVALINGILNPVDLEQAIAAVDGTILQYSPVYVESNEFNLIADLQAWIYGYYSRWYNPHYLFTDDLYLPSFLGQLALQIPLTLHSLRLRNVRTPQVHSFHVRQYLASHGRLDRYLPYLNKAQQLWLYRNIRYLERHVGQQQTLEQLIDRLLTPRGIPLHRYAIEHNTEQLPETLQPQLDMVKYPINFGFTQSGVDRTPVHTILERERPLARENALVEGEGLATLEGAFIRGGHNRLPTKVLESEVVDRSNAAIKSLPTVLLMQWLHLASVGRYRTYVNVDHPATGATINLSVADAFLLAVYAYHRYAGIELAEQDIPRFHAYEVLRITPPPFTELKALTDPRRVKDQYITAIMDRISPVGEYISTESFYEACYQFHQDYKAVWELYSFQENYHARGQLEHVAKAHYQHIPCTLVETGTTWGRWLAVGDYDLAFLSREHFHQLFAACVSAATGLDLVNHLTLAEVQRGLLQLMGDLSSYAVQYVRTINHTDFTYLGDPVIRVGESGITSRGYFKTSGTRLLPLQVRARKHHHYPLLDDQVTVPLRVRAAEEFRAWLEVRTPILVRQNRLAKIHLSTTAVGVLGFQISPGFPIPPTDELGEYQPTPPNAPWPILPE